MQGPLLAVRELTVRLRSSHHAVLENLSFEVAAGETIGLLGESGSGKTTLARALMRLLDKRTFLERGSIHFQELDLTEAGEGALRCIRGGEISLISQEPELALNPFMPAAKQVEEVLRAHARLGRNERHARVQAMLAEVELPDKRTHSAYPHELSGGQRQRFVIAQSLIAQPVLLIADEPTSALDNVTQADILRLFKRLKERLKLALIFITHDPALLYGLADRVLVIDRGRIVEEGSFEQLYRDGQHPYTRTLARSIPPFPAGT